MRRKGTQIYFTLIPFCFLFVLFTLYVPTDIHSFEFHITERCYSVSLIYLFQQTLILYNIECFRQEPERDLGRSEKGEKHGWISIAQ